MKINHHNLEIFKLLLVSLLMLSVNNSSVDISSLSNVDQIKQEVISFELRIDFDNRM
jgi:hypothetical protein